MARNSQHAGSPSTVTFYLIFILLVAALGPFQFGYHLAELNAPQAVITCEKEQIIIPATGVSRTTLPQCIPMRVDQFALTSSIFTLGGLVGALVAGPLCASSGRLRTMRLTTSTFVLGPAFETLATNVPLLALGRFVSGLGAGSAVVVVPIYISEISPPEKRGLFGALTQIMTNVGILVTQSLGYFLSRGSLWRIILAVAGIIGVVQFLALSFVPESPKWLAEHGKLHKARHLLHRIRGNQADLDDEIKSWNVTHHSRRGSAEDEPFLRSPTSESGVQSSSSSKLIGIISAFINPTYRPAIIAVVAVMLAQQLTGINTIVMYSVNLLSALLPTSAALLSVGVSALNLIMTTLCAPLSDILGRKRCILLSIVGMGISSVLLAVGMAQGIKLLGAVATLLFVASFAIGLGPVPFILANELVGPEAVSATQSWALAANWIATFVVSQFFPMLNKAMGERGRVYFVFAGVALAFALFIAWWVPETKGKRGMDEVWGYRVRRGLRDAHDDERARED